MNFKVVLHRCMSRVSRLTRATGYGNDWRTLVFCGLGLMLLAGCGDETKFRPKVGGGLKRDTGDDPPPASPPTNPLPTAGPSTNPTAVAAASDDSPNQPKAQSAPTPIQAASAGSAKPANSAAASPRRVPVTRTRRPGAAATDQTAQMQLECNGKVLFRPLVLKPLLLAPGRKTVWLLTSAVAEDQAQGPAVCIRFETEGETPENWVGRPWHGQMFVRTSGSKQVFATAFEGGVRIEFSAWDDEGAEGRILPGELQSSNDEKPVPYEGTFIATTQVSTAPEGESE